MIEKCVEALLSYGLNQSFFGPYDLLYMRNKLCEYLNIEGYEPTKIEAFSIRELESIIESITHWAFEHQLIKSIHSPYGDLFETALLDILCPRPKEVIDQFETLRKESPSEATDWFYQFSKSTHYIRMDRVAKNILWNQFTKYGPMIMTINLSKPEKDPAAIAEAALIQTPDYPKCLLCIENVGFAGTVNLPSRQTHRVIPIKLGHENWFFQYSPYIYYNEHAIIINEKHVPMAITPQTYERLCDFVDQFPHYFIGSNADLPLVGGSMLTHDHYQGGQFHMPMASGESYKSYVIKGFDAVSVAWLKWPLTVLRLRSESREQIIELAVYLTTCWRNYSSCKDGLMSHTQNEPHHTVTPIVRKIDGFYEIDVVLRSNLKSDSHPMGVFHPHESVHPVKKENIGLIEVMGLAVLPSRLKKTMRCLEKGLYDKLSFKALSGKCEVIGFEKIYTRMQGCNQQGLSISETVQKVIGEVFVEGLEHAGVMPINLAGEEAMDRFIKGLNTRNLCAL